MSSVLSLRDLEGLSGAMKFTMMGKPDRHSKIVGSSLLFRLALVESAN